VRLKGIACDVFFREICALAARCPHKVDLTFLPKGLHDRKSAEMRAVLQAQIDSAGEVDAVVFAYALCGNGLTGLTAGDVPFVVPRAHDCITLFLGSRARYREYFDNNPGVYFKTAGWIERGAGPADRQLSGLDLTRAALAEKYGEDNADYLLEQMGGYTQTYHKFTYIRTGTGVDDTFEARTRREAAARSWEFESLDGSTGLLERLLAGDWDSDDFVVVPPGYRLAATWDERIIEARPR
jgi:hypothetical protein